MLPLNLSGVFPMFTYPGGLDPSAFSEPFGSTYRPHLQHLKLKGLQPKTIDAYARTIRRMGEYFDHQIDDLSAAWSSCAGCCSMCCPRGFGVRATLAFCTPTANG
jgi:hypothetical protein